MNITAPNIDRANFPHRAQAGFALIATISVMTLLLLIALAMLSLSTISLRSETSDQAAEEARQNARLALMMGIAQLQSLTGPDTRITANSRLLSTDDDVSVTGVWRSWEGTNQDNTGKPTIPNYDLKRENGDPTEEPSDSNGDGRFLGWLGTTTSLDADIADLSDFSNTPIDGYIPLVGNGDAANTDGSVTENNDRIFVKPAFLEEQSGAIAWYTSGDNSKAMINVDRQDTPDSVVGWQQRLRGNGAADAEHFGLADINTRPAGSTVPSTKSLKLVQNTAEIRKFHDLTTYNRGLLVNNATGGWKKDLSLMSEQFNELPNSDLPVFTMEPGVEDTFAKATSNNNRPDSGLLYPWSRYRTLNNNAWGTVPPVCSWTALTDYALQYRNLTTSSATRTAMPIHASGIGSGARLNFQEKVRRSPQMARLQWIFSLCSERQSSGQYKAGLMVTPVVTLWNPYNIELTVNEYDLRVRRQGLAPLSFAFQVGSNPPTELVNIGRIINNSDEIRLEINEQFTLAPGATRVFSVTDGNPQNGGKNVRLSPGYTPGGGFRYYGINQGNEVLADGSDSFSIHEIAYRDHSEGAIGIWIETVVNSFSNALRMGYRENELGGEAVLAELYPALVERASTQSLSNVEGANTFAFASAVFGYRTSTPFSPATLPTNSANRRHLITKGMLQSHPLNFYSEVGNQDNGATLSSMANSGVFHPVNAPYDFAFFDVNGWNDTQFLPQLDLGTNSGYIVSGLTVGDGLTRCIMSEIPTRPLQSLAQLQHFDARNNNPVPPFQYNLIGNGSAHPLFEPDSIEIPTSVNSGMINDDAYLLNQMLFDDWYVSSIAPDLDDFGSNISRDLEQVYEDHVNGDEPLPNRFYLPVANAESDTVDEAQDNNTGLYTYQTIASQLVVDGMFNINSVSLDAWKAILRHNRDTETPYITASGSTVTDSATSFPYPRTSIAGDRSADSGAGTVSNGSNPDAAEFAGYRALTDEQIDALAEEIVEEIRDRGPFLSLSEFVNRQLTDDKDLAIAGTIQKALDNLSEKSGSENPYERLQAVSDEITLADVNNIPGNTDYKFPEAAAGYSSYGLPGWVRQADILTPLAPIITARDDTFTIRAYGDARDRNNSDIILATAWCEATVRRVADYVDGTDANTVAPYSSEMTSDINKRYGRRYQMVLFRWLNEKEI